MRSAIILLLLLFTGPVSLMAANYNSSALSEDSPALPGGAWSNRPMPRPESGNTLRELVFSVGGQAVQLKNGGVLALHPDTPFRVLTMRSDAWLDFNLQAELAGLPGVDLVGQVHTLSALLGEDIYRRQYLDVLVLGKDGLIGSVRIMVRMLPIDWLRRAEQSQELDEQVMFWQKAYELAPDDRPLALNLLDGLRRLGRLDQALSILEDYPDLSADGQALKQQGYIYQALGRLNEAIESFKLALEQIPNDEDIQLALVELYESKQQWPEAAAILHQLINAHTATQASETADEQQNQELAALMLRLARAYARVPEKITEALTVYQQYLLIATADSLLWLEIAQLRAQAGQDEASLDARRQALNLAPDNRDMIMQMQNALQRQGKMEQAAQVLQEGLKRLPQEDMLWLELIRIYRESKDSDQLINAYSQYAALHPQDDELQYQLALMLRANGRLEQAMRQMEQALKLRPERADYTMALIRITHEAGRNDEALALAARLPHKDAPPNLWPELYAMFGRSRGKDLARLLDKALEEQNPSPKLYEMRAVLALNQNQTKQAAQILAKAAEKFPDDLRVLYLLAGIYEGLNKDAQAMPIYAKILALDPAYEDVEQRYLQVRIRLLDK